jgi:hypothetical protein
MTIPPRAWIIGGGALAVLGVVLIYRALPAGGELLWSGVLAIVAGTLVMLQAFKQGGAEEEEEPTAPARTADWKPEPELRQVPPRRVGLRRSGQLIGLFWLLLIPGALAFFYFRTYIVPPAREIPEEIAATATATIHSLDERKRDDGRIDYYLAYNFQDDAGNGYRSSVRVSQERFRSHRIGDTLKVDYIPGNAIAHSVPELAEDRIPPRLALFTLVLLAILGFLLDAQRRKHKRLVRSGKTVPGVVGKVARRGGSRSYEVRYEAHGAEQRMSAVERNPDRRNGDVVTVLYSSERPSEAIVYRLALYQGRSD